MNEVENDPFSIASGVFGLLVQWLLFRARTLAGLIYVESSVL